MKSKKDAQSQGFTTDSSHLLRSWAGIYRAILDADSEEVDIRIAEHVKLTRFKESEVWVERIVSKASIMTNPELKVLIEQCEQGVVNRYSSKIKQKQTIGFSQLPATLKDQAA